MFARLPDTAGKEVSITVDGTQCVARAGDTVAAALLVNGVVAFRTAPGSGKPRSAYCLMGACFDCLVTIDGMPNQQGCAIRVRPGMHVKTRAFTDDAPPTP